MVAARTISPEERLDRLESRAAIGELIYAYARCVRRNLAEDAPLLFLPDGVFEIRDGHPGRPEHQLRTRLEGREHIRVYLAQGQGGGRPIPLIHNLMIDVDGDNATANCLMKAQVYGTSHKVLGEYNDSFRRMRGRWFFASRTYTIFKGASLI
jgi:hypothetical protein